MAPMRLSKPEMWWYVVVPITHGSKLKTIDVSRKL